MRTRRLWYEASGILTAALIVVTAGCSSSAPGPGSQPSSSAPDKSAPASSTTTGQPTASPSAAENAAERAAQAVQGPAALATATQLAALRAQAGEIAKLSPEQMAGQRVIYSYNGLSAPAGLLKLIRQGDVGGVIFFSFNISSQQQISSVIAQMVAANNSQDNPARAYPLLLMTDQEGGLVRRIPWAGPQQTEAAIGSSADPAAAATTAGQQAAAGLRAAGMNVNLAPVLDVYRAPGDFDDQYQRSYSMNPDIVAQAGAAFVTAQQAGHVAATVKHFPGLGEAATTQDTDNEPVTINLSAQTLRSVDEAPYTAAIKAGVKLAMVSWANYPALDPRLPAGLSPRIIQGELQRRLGFTGVTITDALGAGALDAYGSLENRAMLAARAGMDALLCTAVKPLPGQSCVSGVRAGLQDGALPRTTFEAQLAQLLQLRASLPT